MEKAYIRGERLSEMSWVTVHITHLCPNSSLLHVVWEVKEERQGRASDRNWFSIRQLHGIETRKISCMK